MEPKYLGFRRRLYKPIILWQGEPGSLRSLCTNYYCNHLYWLGCKGCNTEWCEIMRDISTVKALQVVETHPWQVPLWKALLFNQINIAKQLGKGDASQIGYIHILHTTLQFSFHVFYLKESQAWTSWHELNKRPKKTLLRLPLLLVAGFPSFAEVSIWSKNQIQWKTCLKNATTQWSSITSTHHHISLTYLYIFASHSWRNLQLFSRASLKADPFIPSMPAGSFIVGNSISCTVLVARSAMLHES